MFWDEEVKRVRVCFEVGGRGCWQSSASKGQKWRAVCCVAESGSIRAPAPVCAA